MSTNQKLRNREVLGYSLINVAAIGMTVCSSFLQGFWTDVVGISAATVAVILLAARIFDGVSDIFMGAIIDKTHTKNGKAKPWVLIGSIGLILSSTLVFYVPTGLPMTGKVIYSAVMYFLVFAIFGTMVNVASPTLVNLITTDTEDRFKLGSWFFSMMFIVGLALSFGLNIVTAFGGGAHGYLMMALICNSVAIISLIFAWLSIKERNGQEVLEKQEKVSVKEFLATIFDNKYFLLVTGIYFLNNISAGVIAGSTYYYVAYILNDFGFFAILNIASYLPCIVGTFLGPKLAEKFGVCRVVVVGNIITAIAYLAILLNPTNVPFITACIAIGSFANGPACAVLAPFNAMAADYGEYKHGVARPAVYSAGTSVGTKLGVGVGGMLFSVVLAVTGFDGLADIQPAIANTGIIVSYVVTPAVAMLLFDLLVLPFFKLEKEYPMINEELKKRHAK